MRGEGGGSLNQVLRFGEDVRGDKELGFKPGL